MNKINMLYRASESIEGYQGKLVNKLKQNEIIGRIVVVSRSSDIEADNDVVVIPSQMCWHNMYEYYPEYKAAKPFSRSILNTIKKYEPTALTISRRDTNFDIYTVEEARDLFYKALRFWYGVIIKNKINYMYFSYVPHTTHEYAIYVMGKALGIPMIIFSITTIPHVYVYGDSISTIGNSIIEDYKNVTGVNKSNNIYIRRYLDRMMYKNDSIKFDLVDRKKASKKRTDEEYFRYVRIKSIIFKILHYTKCFICLDNKELEFGKKEFRDTIRAYHSLFHQVSLRRYNKIASLPDFQNKYIYYALHLNPEATVSPGGGVFENQLFAIKLLAKAAEKYGVLVYVKAHYCQSTFDKSFFYDLKSIPNIVLIKTEVSSNIIIEKSLAVASLTGSCLIEGVLSKKPAFIFGDNYYWKGIPGGIVVDNQEQCESIIKDILHENYITVKDSDIENYFYSVEKNSINDYMFFPKQEELSELPFEKVIEDKIRVVFNDIENISKSVCCTMEN